MPRPTATRTKAPRRRAEPATAAVAAEALPIQAATRPGATGSRPRADVHSHGPDGIRRSFERGRAAAMRRGGDARTSVRRRPIVALLIAGLCGFVAGLMMAGPRHT
jgi:hypothetical protein